MSILIKGMKIPQGCQKCKFFTKHTFGRGIDYSYSCLLGAKKFPMPWIKQEFERAEDCPLAEIPRHGRLIDADKLYARTIEEAVYSGDDGRDMRYRMVQVFYKEDIDEAPTIIEGEKV